MPGVRYSGRATHVITRNAALIGLAEPAKEMR
jgi:hypothetical protein